jgi:hypothetical protein
MTDIFHTNLYVFDGGFTVVVTFTVTFTITSGHGGTSLTTTRL